MNKFISKRKIFFISIALFLLNFFLKILYITYSDLGADEPFTIYFSQLNFSDLMEMLKNENNPPLHFILTHFWIKIFGISEFSVRFPSVLFSSFSVVIIFLIGQKFFSTLIGIATCLFYTGSTLHMYYAHDARVYSMFFFINCCSFYFYLNILAPIKSNDKKMLVGFILSNILLCYSHFFGFIIIFVEVLIVILIPQLRIYFLKILISVLIIIGSFIWYIPILIERFKISSGGTWVPKTEITDIYSILWSFSNKPVLTVFFICILLYSFLFNWKKLNIAFNINLKILLLLFIICFIGLFFISLKFPVFIARYLLFASLYYYLLIAVALKYIFKSEKLSYLIYLALPLLMLTTLNPKEGKNARIHDLSEFIKPLLIKPINIIINPEWYDLNFLYYFNPEWFTITKHLRDTLISNSIFPVNPQNKIPFINKLWPVLLIDHSNKNDSLKQFLNQQFQYKETGNFNGELKLILYDVKIK